MLRLGIPAFVVKARGAAIEDLETCGFLAAHDAPYPHWNNRLPLDGSSGQRALHEACTLYAIPLLPANQVSNKSSRTLCCNMLCNLC